MKMTMQLPNGDIYSGELAQVEQVQYYRVPHDPERDISDWRYMGDGVWNTDMVRDKSKPIPEVYRLYPDQVTPLDCRWIKFWWALNPMLNREHFELLLDNRWMLTNGTGWPGRYNCLTGELAYGTNPYKPPAFHAALINGGATVTGKKVGGILWLDSLITSLAVPFNVSDKEAAKNWWENNPTKWYYATTIAQSGNITYTTFAGIDGNRQKLRIPILTKEPVYIPIRELDILPLGFFPPNSLWRPSK